MTRSAHRSWAIVLVLAGLASSAQAQVEPIFLPVPPGPDGVTLFFPNLIPPAPDHKLLRYSGFADSHGFPGPTSVSVQFDWLLPAGGFAVSPTMTFPVTPFTSSPVDTGYYRVDFCPTEVSLHFLTDSPTGMSMSGSFEHLCVAVPEPGSAMVVLAAAGTALFRRRKRHLS